MQSFSYGTSLRKGARVRGIQGSKKKGSRIPRFKGSSNKIITKQEGCLFFMFYWTPGILEPWNPV